MVTGANFPIVIAVLIGYQVTTVYSTSNPLKTIIVGIDTWI
jgi:hypothetical protein